MKKQNKCSVCGSDLFAEPLLQYKNMPAAAQYLPVEKDKGVDLTVCQCSACGLVQLNNEPVSYYREVIRAAGISDEMQAFRKAQFEGFVKKYGLEGKKIIEIGCGQGEYLSVMQKAGADAYGLEYSAGSVKVCLKKGLKVERGYIEKATDKIKNDPFAAFFILNFLEHLPNINVVLQGISNNLTDDGLGLVEVPNFDMMLKKNLFSEFIGDHLFYFTKDTLKTVLELNGFEVLECSEIWHDYIISAVVRKNPSTRPLNKLGDSLGTGKKLDLNQFYKQQEKLKKELNGYVKDRKVAVWGAGHQALAMISLADIGSKIKYVVDSAPFKQGKFTPATHIPIVAPATLESDPVDAIIVMAASYSDEVVKIIRQKFNKDLQVAILRDFGLEGS